MAPGSGMGLVNALSPTPIPMRFKSPTLVVSLLLVGPAPAQFANWTLSSSISELGTGVEVIGDLDGDGAADVLYADPEFGATGQVRVMSGAGASLIHLITASAVTGAPTHVAALGDLTGDGVPEFAHNEGLTWRLRDGATANSLWTASGTTLITVMRGVGDVNGDGYDDLAIGRTGASGRGEVEVWSGLFLGTNTGPLRVWEKDGTQVNGLFGFSLDATGDVDGDGLPDIIVGAYHETGQNGLFTWSGRVHMLKGTDGSSLWTDVMTDSVGNNNTDHGYMVAGVGDVNGDGTPDVLVGAPQADWTGTNNGVVQVLSGTTGSTLEYIEGISGDHFGSSGRGIGDVDSNGTLDFAIGAPYHDHNGSNVGKVTIFSGGDYSVMGVVYGDLANQNAGVKGTLAGGLDATGDGRANFVVGGPNPISGVNSKLWLYSFICEGEIGVICTAAPNSVSPTGGKLIVTGLPDLSNNGMGLIAQNLPPGQPGIFFYGNNVISSPFGDGFLCVSGSVSRLDPVTFANGVGTSAIPLDFTAYPMNSGPGEVLAGSTWYFQHWYRDPGAGGSGFNLTDGAKITFCP